MPTETDFETAFRLVKITTISAGLVGNLVTFLVYSRKTFQKNSMSTYCRALVVAECMILAQLLTELSMLFKKIAPLNMSDFMCKTVMYIFMEMSAIPGWILVALSVDKALCMSRKQFPILKKKSFQWSVVASIVMFNLLLYIEIPISIKLQRNSTFLNILYCDLATLNFFTPLIIVDLLETTLIPFAILMVISVITIRLIYKSRRSLEISSSVNIERRNKETKFAITTVAFNFMYVILKTPNIVWYIMYGIKIQTSSYFLIISFFLFLLNSSATFFVNFATNSIFRRELYIICGLRKVSITGQNVQMALPNRFIIPTIVIQESD